MKIDWGSKSAMGGIVGCFIVVAWVLWPISTPLVQQVKDNASLPVDVRHSVVQTVVVPSRTIDGLDIQVENASELPSESSVILTLRSGDDNHVMRIIETQLGNVLSSDKLRFRFPATVVEEDGKIVFEIATPTLPEKHPLFIRYFTDTKDISYTVFAPQSQVISLVQQILHTNTIGTDIALTYEEGGRILHGENPYNRILKGNLQDNNSYATYLPSFYLLSAVTQWAGLESYAQWIGLWRPIFLVFALATAIVLFSSFWRRGLYILAFFAAGFFLFNRWSLYIATVGLFDFIPIFFLISSLLLFRKHPLVSLFILGLSLSFRHIGAILLPLYCIALWQSAPVNSRGKKMLQGAISFIALPLAVSLPFIITNSSSFMKSMLFSFTRGPVTHFSVPSVDAFLGLVGPSAKIGMLVLLCCIYYGYARKYLSFFVASFIVFLVFLNFHSVWFAQYMAYAAPIGMLALLELVEIRLGKKDQLQ